MYKSNSTCTNVCDMTCKAVYMTGNMVTYIVQCLVVLLDVIDFLCTLVGIDRFLYTQDRDCQ